MTDEIYGQCPKCGTNLVPGHRCHAETQPLLLSAQIKRKFDQDTRDTFVPEIAERIISSNREVRIYQIRNMAGQVKLSGGLFSKGTHWETLLEIECDWDDAIAWKEAVAKNHGLDRTRLVIFKVEEIDE